MTDTYFLGIDIGGTKCAVLAGTAEMEILDRIQFETRTEKGPTYAIEKLLETAENMVAKFKQKQLLAVGISCGGPLNSKTGMIQSPPNLPGWDNIPITQMFSDKFGMPAFVQNDANACALAEWKFGAGKGCDNMIFMTFGTGLGAGLILDGKLYAGTNDLAGEIGHIRLADDGPEAYGKKGSFEAFCSGSGMAKLAQIRVVEKLHNGEKVTFCSNEDEIENISAKSLALAANAGDETALGIFHESATYLGIGLSVLIDVLNPQRIVIGSVYARNPQLFNAVCKAVIEREALKPAWEVCEIVPAALGDKVGDYASLSVAIAGFGD